MVLKASVLLLSLALVSVAAPHVASAATPEAGVDVLKLSPSDPRMDSLKIESIALQPTPVADELMGRVVYDEDRTTRITAPISGRVTRIEHQLGDAVAKGGALLQLDSPDLGSAWSDVAKANADLMVARAAHERAKKLYEGKVLARKDLEQAEGDFHKAEAEAERARLRVGNLGVDNSVEGERWTLRAPIAGIITERHVNPGLEVRPDLADPLYVVTDPSHLWIYVDIPEAALSMVHPGAPVTVRVDAIPDVKINGAVKRIADVLDPDTHRVTATIEVDNPKRLLKVGMYARVVPLSGKQAEVVVVPNSALVTQGLHTFVLVESKPGELHKRLVVLGLQARDFSVVAQGLNPGERIVTRGASLLSAELRNK